jgi:hypothetical protein
LFKLRGVDHEELIAADAEAAVSAATSRGKSKRLNGGELSDVFGIDLDTSEAPAVTKRPRKKAPKKATTDASSTRAAKKAPKPRAKSVAVKKVTKTAAKK